MKLFKKQKIIHGQTVIASTVLPLLGGDEEDGKSKVYEEDYKKAYEEQSDKLEGAFVPAENTRPTMDETYGSDMFYANQGGLATAIPKFNQRWCKLSTIKNRS